MGRSCQKWLDKILTYNLLPFRIVPFTTYSKFRLAQPIWVRSHITKVERGIEWTLPFDLLHPIMTAPVLTYALTFRLIPLHSDFPRNVSTCPITFRLAPLRSDLPCYVPTCPVAFQLVPLRSGLPCTCYVPTCPITFRLAPLRSDLPCYVQTCSISFRLTSSLCHVRQGWSVRVEGKDQCKW